MDRRDLKVDFCLISNRVAPLILYVGADKIGLMDCYGHIEPSEDIKVNEAFCSRVQ